MYYLLVECLYSFLVFLIISHILLVNKTVIVSTLCIVTMGHNLWHVMEYLGCFRLCLAPIRFVQKKEKRSWKDSLRKSYEKFLLYGCPWKVLRENLMLRNVLFVKCPHLFFSLYLKGRKIMWHFPRYFFSLPFFMVSKYKKLFSLVLLWNWKMIILWCISVSLIPCVSQLS